MATPYLDTEAILNAAELVNSTLISKGYISNKLLFNSINWKDLCEGQSFDEVNITEPIYNNDKNTINIIYSLLQSIERNATQNKTFNKIVAQKDDMITSLNKKIASLEQKVDSSESKLEQFTQIERTKLTSKLQDLTRVNKLQNQDLIKLKHWCNDIKSKYTVELKKKNLEINQLKDKLLEKRNLSSTLTLGIPLTNRALVDSTYSEPVKVNPAIVYNNSPNTNNVPGDSGNGNETSSLPFNKEYESMMVDLTQLIENLIGENFKFSKFIQHINSYYHELNIQISSFNNNKRSIEIPNPSDSIDLEDLASIAESSAHASDLVNELESFEFVSKPLLNNIYKNYHYISDLVTNVTGSENRGGNSSTNQKTIEALTSELEIVRKNWQDAILTLENWKKYPKES